MSPSERYLAVTVGPDSNAAIQALYNALTGELLIVNSSYFLVLRN